MISTEEIIKIAGYFTIISHTPGRLRARVNPKIAKEAGNISLADIEALPNKIKGIKEIKIKKIIASLTIIYDPEIFIPSIWDDLVNKSNLDEVTNLINNLSKELI